MKVSRRHPSRWNLSSSADWPNHLESAHMIRTRHVPWFDLLIPAGRPSNEHGSKHWLWLGVNSPRRHRVLFIKARKKLIKRAKSCNTSRGKRRLITETFHGEIPVVPAEAQKHRASSFFSRRSLEDLCRRNKFEKESRRN